MTDSAAAGASSAPSPESPALPAALALAAPTPDPADRTPLLDAGGRHAPVFLHVLRGGDFVFELANATWTRRSLC